MSQYFCYLHSVDKERAHTGLAAFPKVLKELKPEPKPTESKVKAYDKTFAYHSSCIYALFCIFVQNFILNSFFLSKLSQIVEVLVEI